jgi:hypothetical protein
MIEIEWFTLAFGYVDDDNTLDGRLRTINTQKFSSS